MSPFLQKLGQDDQDKMAGVHLFKQGRFSAKYCSMEMDIEPG